MSCLRSALRRYIKNSSILNPNGIPLCLQRCHNFNISCQTHTCVTNGVADNLLCCLSKSHFGNPKAITVASPSITAQHDSTQLNKHRDQYQPKPSDHRRLLLPGLSEAISISSFSTTARYYSLTKLHKYRGQYWFKRKNDRHRIALYGLAVFTTVESINAHFAKFGTVSDSGIGKRIPSGFTGFVEFESIDNANAAAKFFPHVIDDREVSVVRYSEDKLNKCRIVVWDLPYKCPSIKTIQKFYSQFGAIHKCHMGSNKTHNYAVISFKTNKQARRALEARPHIIDGIVLQAKSGDTLNTRTYPIFVGSLPRNVTEKLLIEAFSMFGKLVYWELFNDDRFLIKLRRDRPFAFISYSAEKEAIRAQKYGARAIDGHVLDLKSGKAMTSLLRDINEYKRQRSSKGSSSLFIPFLPENVTEKSLTEVFSKFGVLKSLDLVNDERLIKDGKKTPPYATISYATQEDALKAFDSGPHTVEGKLVRALTVSEMSTALKKRFNIKSSSMRQRFNITLNARGKRETGAKGKSKKNKRGMRANRQSKKNKEMKD